MGDLMEGCSQHEFFLVCLNGLAKFVDKYRNQGVFCLDARVKNKGRTCIIVLSQNADFPNSVRRIPFVFIWAEAI